MTKFTPPGNNTDDTTATSRRANGQQGKRARCTSSRQGKGNGVVPIATRPQVDATTVVVKG